MVVVMQTTLNNRIEKAFGVFWEPFPWGEPEQAWLNEVFQGADMWAMSRMMYEAIVPWWDEVAARQIPSDVDELHPLHPADIEFAAIQMRLLKVVFSSSLEPGPDRRVISGDLVGQLAALKAKEGGDIMLSCGPRTLVPLAAAPGLIDEYIIAIHPAVIAAGSEMFEGLETDLALELVESRVFEGGAVVLRYRVLSTGPGLVGGERNSSSLVGPRSC
jgi:dihydrofolate reductase